MTDTDNLTSNVADPSELLLDVSRSGDDAVFELYLGRSSFIFPPAKYLELVKWIKDLVARLEAAVQTNSPDVKLLKGFPVKTITKLHQRRNTLYATIETPEADIFQTEFKLTIRNLLSDFTTLRDGLERDGNESGTE